jgi:multimeric flavodoxin WrbA
MKIVILDGRNQESNPEWRKYMTSLVKTLENRRHQVRHFILADQKIHHCTGCFSCWVKTPGECIFDDDSREINRATINSDFVLWAAPLVMGFPSFQLKRVMDRTIPLIHPYFAVVNGEAHHRSRYEKYPLFGLLFQPEKADNDRSITVVKQLFARTALNIKSRLSFAESNDVAVEELVQRIEKSRQTTFQISSVFHDKPFKTIEPPKRLVVFNGSPRGRTGNTPILLNQLIEGFGTKAGNSSAVHHLHQTSKMRTFKEAFENAECVMLGFPLYTDGMPGIVKEFIEAIGSMRLLKPVPIGFLVQSGFPEALHSRYVEQYLMVLADRLKSPYLGTIVRGGCEGVRLMPEKMNRKLFNGLNELGSQLADEGRFVKEKIQKHAGLERISPLLVPAFKLATMTPLLNVYWNMQLKENGAFETRFAKPYIP